MDKQQVIKPIRNDNVVELYSQEYDDHGDHWDGREALTHAVEHGWTIHKFADPIESARLGLTVQEALDVMYDDDTLIWLSR